MGRRIGQLSWWARATASMAVDLLPDPFAVAIRRGLLRSTLRELNDALAGTPLSGRYWLDGGLLLGWARAGGALVDDLQDVDFGVLAEDFPRLVAAVPALEAAGFSVLHVVRAPDGEPLSAHFARRGVQFDFVKAVPSDGKLLLRGTAEVPALVTYERPHLALGSFHLFGREWLKPEDHEAALAAHYGNWRSNWRKDWSTPRDSPSVVAVEPSAEWPWASGRPMQALPSAEVVDTVAVRP